MDQKF